MFETYRAAADDVDDFDYDEEHVDMQSEVGEYGNDEDDEEHPGTRGTKHTGESSGSGASHGSHGEESKYEEKPPQKRLFFGAPVSG